ncbi:hypothetical protein [Haladaptatus sp. NG-WS-4]
MPIFDRTESIDYQVIDRWGEGVGWLAHPDEDSRRASHAIVGDNGGVWLIDPLDTPGLDGLLSEVGRKVVGVAVLSKLHVRDAGILADRYDVPVFVPQEMDGITEQVEAPIERCSETLGDSGFRIHRLEYDTIMYRDSDRTLYVPDLLGTVSFYTVGDERIGLYLLGRLSPPEDLSDFVPDCILVGHGAGILTNAPAALENALRGARRRFPRALLTNGLKQIRATYTAMKE